MKCSDCGYDLKEEDKKCPRCGREVNSNSGKKKLQKKHLIMILAIVLSVLSICLAVIGFKSFSSPKTVMLQSVSNFASNVKDSLTQVESTFIKQIADQDRVKLDGTLEVEIDPALELGIENFGINFAYTEDEGEEKTTIDMAMVSGENSLFDLDMIMADSKLYFDLKEITENYYYMDFDYISLFENVASIDYGKLVDIAKDNFTAQIDQDKIEESKQEITLGDKKKKATKLSYRVTNQMINATLSGMLEDIENDQELLDNLAKMNGVSKEEFLDSIDQAIQGMQDIQGESYFYYNVYYYGFNNIVMEEITDDTISLQYYHYDQTEEIIVMSEGQELFYIQMVENGNKIDIDGNLSGYTFSGNYQKQQNGGSIELTLELGTDRLTLALSTSNMENKDQLRSKVELKITGNFQGVDLKEGITIRCDAAYTYGEEVQLPDLSGAKDINMMTEEEMNTIITNIQNHPFLSTIYNSLVDSTTGDDDSIYDDYDDSIYDDYTDEESDIFQDDEYSY